MPRRSSRLQSNGYYGCDGKPVNSYKETMYRVFKKCKSGLRPRYDGSPDTELGTELYMPPHTELYSELDPPDQTGPANRPWRMSPFVLFLCFGLVLTLAVMYGDITTPYAPTLDGAPFPHSIYSSTLHLHIEKIFTGSSKDLRIHLREFREKLEELKEFREKLEELKEFREKLEELKEFREELEELKEKMELVHPLSNFALETQGSRILTEETSESYPPQEPGKNFFGFTMINSKQPPSVSPRILLQGQAPSPGNCWAFKGSKGKLSVELSHSILVSHVSIGHIPKNLSPDETTSTAPWLFSVFGRRNIKDARIYLGTFEYDTRGRPLQLFEMVGHGRNVVKYLTLKIYSNWGNHRYTCIYSFRVHGKLAPLRL